MSGAFLIMSTLTLDKDLAVQRLQAALRLVENLAAGDWPYPDSADAILAIRNEFSNKLSTFAEIDDASDDIVSSWCKDVRALVARYLSFVGVIVRSADLRNAFELYYPVRSMCTGLLGDDFKVVLGSEWTYIPFVYPLPTKSLEKFIFFGLPASEAENPLLTPIAGHELGHAIWRRTAAAAPVAQKVVSEIVERFSSKAEGQESLFPGEPSKVSISKDLQSRALWAPAYEMALKQCEEIFCDLVGTWLFGSAFAHAFRYLMAPDFGARLSEYYPSNRVRAQAISAGLKQYHGISSNLVDIFPASPELKVHNVNVADATTNALMPDIIKAVDAYCSKSVVSKPTSAGIKNAELMLRQLRPANDSVSPAEVINAGWKLRLELKEWAVPGVQPTKRIFVLNDLILKSFEVHEWTNLQKAR